MSRALWSWVAAASFAATLFGSLQADERAVVLAQDSSRWSFPQPLVESASGRGQEEVDLWVDHAGGLHAVWQERSAGTAASNAPGASIRYAHRPWARTWLPPITVVSGPAAAPVVVLDSDGAVHVLFELPLLERAAIAHAVMRTNESSFSKPEYVDAVAAPQWKPALVADPWGRVHAAWTDLRGENADLRHAMREPDGRWTPSVLVHAAHAPGDQRDIDLAMNVSGDLHAIWRDTRGRRSGIFAARLPAGSHVGRGDAWWPDESLARTVGGLQRSPHVVADGTGRLVAAWVDEGDGGTVRVASRPDDAGPWELDRIRYRPARGALLDIALGGGGGRAFVAWGETRDPGARLYGAWVDERLADEPLRLDRAPALIDARRQAVALDGLGAVTAVWDSFPDRPTVEGVSQPRRLLLASLPLPPVNRAQLTTSGWLQYVPSLHNCHGDGYQLLACDGTPGLTVTSRNQRLDAMLGGFVEIDGVTMGENACRRLEVVAARVKSAPCPRDTASASGVLFDDQGPVRGAVVRLGPLSTVTGPTGRYFFDRLPPDRYPITATMACGLSIDGGLIPLRAGQRMQIAPAILTRGDVNADGRIDVGDLSAVAARFRRSGPLDVPCTDLDRDGGVDLDDLQHISARLGLASPLAWSQQAPLAPDQLDATMPAGAQSEGPTPGVLDRRDMPWIARQIEIALPTSAAVPDLPDSPGKP